MDKEEMTSQDKENIIKNWVQFSEKFKPGELTQQEKIELRQARVAEEQGKKTYLILGGPI